MHQLQEPSWLLSEPIWLLSAANKHVELSQLSQRFSSTKLLSNMTFLLSAIAFGVFVSAQRRSCNRHLFSRAKNYERTLGSSAAGRKIFWDHFSTELGNRP